MRCENCGARIPKYSKFCLNCGQQVEPETSDNSVHETDGNAMRKKYLLLLWILIGTLTLAVLVTGLIYLLRQSRENDQLGDWRLTHAVIYKADGSVGVHATYEYDQNGYKIKEETYNDKNIHFWAEYQNDTKGNPALITTYNSVGEVMSSNVYEYDANGNQTLAIHIEPNGRFQSWTESKCEYDANGNLILKTLYNEDSSISKKIRNEYDANGRQIRKTVCEADGSISSRYEYDYDADGNLLRETEFSADDSVMSSKEYAYDANGNRIKETAFNGDGSVSMWDEIEYDANGNQTKIIKHDPDGTYYTVRENEWTYFKNALKTDK